MLDVEAMNETNTLNDKTLTQPEPNVTVTNMSQQQVNTQVETTAEHQLAEEWARVAQLGVSDKPQEEVRGICGENDPDIDQLARIIQSETRIKQLKNHMDVLWEMATSRDEAIADTNNETATVDAIVDVTTNEFKIDRGRNT